MKKQVQIVKYPSGTTLLVDTQKEADYIAFSMYFDVGAMDESPKEYGLAHFFEHLFFKSTKTKKTEEISAYMANMGTNINASTNMVRTSYIFKCLKENFDASIAMYSEMFNDGLFLPEEVDKERSVVIEEIKRYKDLPESVCHANAMKSLFSDSPFCHDVAGTEDIIKNISIKEILAFKKKYYTPANTTFSVYGNISKSEAKKTIEKHFYKNIFPETPIKTVKRKENYKSVTKDNYVLENQDRQQAQVYVFTKTDPMRKESMYIKNLASIILGGSMSSRMFVNLRQKLGLAYATWADNYHTKYFGTFMIYIATSPNKVKESLTNIKLMLKNLATNGVTQEELDRAKQILKANLTYGKDNKLGIAIQNANKYRLFGEILTMPEILKVIQGITLEQVNQFYKEIYDQKDFVVSVVGKDVTKKDLKVFEKTK